MASTKELDALIVRFCDERAGDEQELAWLANYIWTQMLSNSAHVSSFCPPDSPPDVLYEVFRTQIAPCMGGLSGQLEVWHYVSTIACRLSRETE